MRLSKVAFTITNNQQLRLTNADMAASAAVANVLLLKKRADDRQRAALRIKFEVFLIISLCDFYFQKCVFYHVFLVIAFVYLENCPWFH